MPLKRALARTMASAFDDELRVTPRSLENHRKNQEVDLLCTLFCALDFANAFVSPGVISRAELVPSLWAYARNDAPRRLLGENAQTT
jgi:hypothetical protein